MDWTNYATGCVHSMKKSNDLNPMNPEDFEKQLERQPLRPLPADWRAGNSPPRKTAAAPRLSRRAKSRTPRPSFLSTLNHQLSTLLWPCPRRPGPVSPPSGWLILAVNYSTADKTPVMAQATPPPTPEMIRMVQEQRRVLAQLIEPR